MMDEAKEVMALVAGDTEWQPTVDQLRIIEKMAYNNVTAMADIALLLDVTVKQIAASVAKSDAIIKAVKRGKLRALIDLNQSMMDQAVGNTKGDPSSVVAAKFLLGARFDYDEKNKLTKIQIKQMLANIKHNNERLQLEKDKLKYTIDHNAAKMASEASEEQLYKWSGVDGFNS